MESKRRRRMIRTELDRLLGDEGTRNLLSGIKLLNKNNKKLGRIVTRNKGLRSLKGTNTNTATNKSTTSSSDSPNKIKTKKIIKKSLSLLGHRVVKHKLAVNGGNTTTTTTAKGTSNNTTGVVNGGVSSSSSSSTTSSSSSRSSTTSSSTTSNNVGVGVVVGSSSTRPSNNKLVPLLATSTRDHVGFITLAYQSHTCTLSNQDLRDLTRKVEEYEGRDEISVIVLNSSSDRVFCDGLDYKELIHSDLNKRKVAVHQRIHYVKSLLTSLVKSKKLLVASVKGGKVSGFGFLLLGLFDLVYATDKATFSLQKCLALGQPPEGISCLNESQLNSTIMRSVVYGGRSVTASEMNEGNMLVTEVVWDSTYHEQLGVKLQSLWSLKNTKFIYKSYSSKSLKQLSTEVGQEMDYLASVWMSDDWQARAQAALLIHKNTPPP